MNTYLKSVQDFIVARRVVLIGIVLVAANCIIYTGALLYGSAKFSHTQNSWNSEVTVQKTPTPTSSGDDISKYSWPVSYASGSDELARNMKNPYCQARESYCKQIGLFFDYHNCDCLPEEVHTYQRYQNSGDGFEMYFPSMSWKDVTTSVTQTVAGDVDLIYQRSGSNCQLTYGVVNPSLLKGGLARNKSIDINGRTIQQTVMSDSFPVSTMQKVLGTTDILSIVIPHFPNKTSPRGVIMSPYYGQTLMDVCGDQLDLILSTVDWIYPEGSILKNQNGVLSIESQMKTYSTEESIQNKYRLVFYDSDEKQYFRIAAKEFDGITDLRNTKLIGDSLFYITTGRLHKINIFENSVEEIPLDYSQNDYVVSYYVDGDSLFYLAGPDCSDYLATCDLTLYYYSQSYHYVQKIVDHLNYRDILGFKTNERKNLYLGYSDGDAGCYWWRKQSVDINADKLNSDRQEDQGCGDDSKGYESSGYEIESTQVVGALVLQNGKIYATDEFNAQLYQLVEPITFNTNNYTYKKSTD
ncbi:hypothetical protein HGA91_05340 [candidate division WWE3 bacterium]|nr:hypothetical protein [candidate division WWE3 bacterium]